MFDFSEKTVLVTGSTQGIGFSIAKGLSQKGALIYVNGASSMEKCKNACTQIPGSRPAFISLEDDDCAEKLFDLTGPVDILVLNASIQIRAGWQDITLEQFSQQMKINVQSNLALIQKYAPPMLEKRWGRILSVGSVQQVKPHPDMTVYAAGKCALMSMVTNFAKQFAPYGVTVNNLSPGVIDTPRNALALANTKYSQMVLSRIPCGYAGTPEDCVAGALLLCSQEGRYITGIDLPIDGGMRL